MLSLILNTQPLNVRKQLMIYDARPYLNAMASKLKKGGYENTKHYLGCNIVFCDIDNIHVVREAFIKMFDLS